MDIEKDDVLKLLQDKELMDAVIQRVAKDPDTIGSLAKETADKFFDVIENDPAFKKKLIDTAISSEEFKKKIIEELVEELS